MFAKILKDSAASTKAWLSRDRGFSTRGTNGWSDEHEARMKALKVPPGVKHIRVNDDPNAPLQAKWNDSKGREVRLYSSAHSEQAAAEKWQRVKEFHKSGAARKVMDSAKSDMNNPKLSAKERDIAAVVYLVAKTGFRIGSERNTGADVQAFGASTLQKGHIKVKGKVIDFQFTGKKGVTINKMLEDEPMAKYLTSKMKSLKATDKVFDASDANARDYVKANGGGEFKVKDFRTWQATAQALRHVKSNPVPTNQTEANKLRKSVATVVANHLGNTPTIALKSYIPPFVFESWGTFSSPPPPKTKATKSEEQSLFDLMEEAVETVFYDEVGDWHSIPGWDDEDDVVKSETVGFRNILIKI